MATSGSTNFLETRDSIITRALRICGAIGQGQTPNTLEISEAAQALNDIVKSLEADGMELWHRLAISITPIAATNSYAIGIGQTTNVIAPLKVIQAYYRNNSTNYDTPLKMLTRQEYDILGAKFSSGSPNLWYYEPPGATTGEMVGTLTVTPVPDANFVASSTIRIIGITPLQDFDASTDNPDFPSFWYNALIWRLAAELAYEYGVPLSERAMISKRADEEHANAMSFDTEEGSIYFQPLSLFYR